MPERSRKNETKKRLGAFGKLFDNELVGLVDGLSEARLVEDA